MSDSLLTLERLTDIGYVNIRGNAQDAAFLAAVRTVCGVDVPVEANTVNGAVTRLCWLGPDEWLLMAESSQIAGLSSRLDEKLRGQHAAINDISGGQVTYRVAGGAARRLLAKGCTLDLHPEKFAVGQCAQTGLAKSGALIFPMKDGQGYEIVVRRSFSDYLWQWLLHAGREYMIEVA